MTKNEDEKYVEPGVTTPTTPTETPTTPTVTPTIKSTTTAQDGNNDDEFTVSENTLTGDKVPDYLNAYGEGSTAPKSVDWVGYKPKEDAKQGAGLSKVGDYKESLYAPSAKKTPEEEQKQKVWEMEKKYPWLKGYDTDEGIDWKKVYEDNPDMKPSTVLRLTERYVNAHNKQLAQSDFMDIIGSRDPNKSSNDLKKDRKRALWATAIDQIGNIAFNAVNAFAIGADPKGLYTPTTFGEKMQAKDEELRKQNLSQYWDAYKTEQKKQEEARALAAKHAYDTQLQNMKNEQALQIARLRYQMKYGDENERRKAAAEAKMAEEKLAYAEQHPGEVFGKTKSNSKGGGKKGGKSKDGSGKSKGSKTTGVDSAAAGVVPQTTGSGKGKVKKA